jgi:phosphonate transport system substrate-binding protein
MRSVRGALLAIVVCVGAGHSRTVAAQDACPAQGQLDAIYCDRDGDLVADAPADAAKWRDPSTLVWAYTPVEDPAVYAVVFKPFTDHLKACTGKNIVYYPVQSNSAEIEAMRSGRLHFAGFSTGPTGFAVNLAGAVPFAAKGLGAEVRGYNLLAVVKASSPYKTLADLKGKKVAHTAPSSNSGNLAPRVLFPAEGLKPDDDYKPLMSGGHDKSILGVNTGDYDMAAVASDVFDRMAGRGTIKLDEFRII